MRAEQLIYTTANVRGKKGYQVVAKSRGIDDGIESFLRPPPPSSPGNPAGGPCGVALPRGAQGRQRGVLPREEHRGGVRRQEGHAVQPCPGRLQARLCRDRVRHEGPGAAASGEQEAARRPPPGRARPVKRAAPPSPADVRALRPVFAGALRLLLDGERVAVPSGDPATAQKFLSLLPPCARLGRHCPRYRQAWRGHVGSL